MVYGGRCLVSDCIVYLNGRLHACRVERKKERSYLSRWDGNVLLQGFFGG